MGEDRQLINDHMYEDNKEVLECVVLKQLAPRKLRR